ncbi:MAG: hypothetical protein DBY34_03450 [Oscillospiraceae bacterium]|nr:MAG: hypothetical protein DBY34_03450 [Oscillospiraceae bacterium]
MISVKEWKSGREALAQAAKGQVCFVFGERRQETASLLDLLEEPGCSRPEEAIDRAFGTSIAGARALCVLSASSAGVLSRISDLGCGGGILFLLVGQEDAPPADLRPLAQQLELPLLTPAVPQDCASLLGEGFALSGKIAAPVLAEVGPWLLDAASMVEFPQGQSASLLDYQRESGRFVRLPGAEKQKIQLAERRKALLSWLEVSPCVTRKGEGETGLIVTGGMAHSVPQMERLAVLQLGMGWPVNLEEIRRFSQSVEHLYLLEKGRYLAPILAEAGIPVEPGLPWAPEETISPDLPARPPQLCPGCPWRGVLYTLKKEKASVFVESGCLSLGAGLLMKGVDGCGAGSPLALAMGFAASRPGKAGKTAALLTAQGWEGCSFAQLGDFSSSRIFAVVLEDAAQPAQLTPQQVARAMDIPIVEADSHSLSQIRDGVRSCMARPGSVLILHGSCAAKEESLPAHRVDRELCTGCRQCLRMGCPAISFPEHKSAIDPNCCAGCGLCGEICPVKAIQKGEKA